MLDDLTGQDRGYAIAPVLKTGNRSAKSFQSIQVLCADIDHGQLFREVAGREWVRQNVAFMYTTANHTEEENRFRVVVVLRTSISDQALAKDAINGMIVMFSGDKSCKDVARLYFGNPGSTVQQFGNELSDDALEYLIQLGRSRTAADTAKAHNPQATGAQRSSLALPHDVHVYTDAGELVPLRDLPAGARFRCPMHVDTRSSAFRVHSRRLGLYCSACDLSFYVPGSQTTDDKSWFDYDWRRPRTFTQDEKVDNMDADESFSNIEQSRGLTIVNERFLEYREPPLTPRQVMAFSTPFEGEYVYQCLPNDRSDILLIKSPKGTGKTEWLVHYIADLKANGYSVLVISHRRSLIQSLCNRLGLASYIDAAGRWQEPTRHFAICLDSLHKLSTAVHKYDVVLVDESEQVISHCLSATFKENRRTVLLKLQHILSRSMRMVLLDADLSKLTVETLADMFPEKSQQTYINDWKPSGAAIHVVDEVKPQQVVGELVRAIQRGERVVVCSNSKADIDLLAIQLPLHCGIPSLKHMAVTSDNSQTPQIQGFLSNITTEILKYDVFLASPSISTGVDISFPDGAQMIDLVVGIFRPLVTTHLEIDQQLLRVRNPRKTLVWVAGDKFAFDTDPGVIRAEIEASQSEHRVLKEITKDGKEIYLRDEVYDRIFSNVTAMQRASKNNLRDMFVQYRRFNGCLAVHDQVDPELVTIGAAVMKTGKEDREARRIDCICNAPTLTRTEYDAFKILEERAELSEQRKRPAIPS